MAHMSCFLYHALWVLSIIINGFLLYLNMHFYGKNISIAQGLLNGFVKKLCMHALTIISMCIVQTQPTNLVPYVVVEKAVMIKSLSNRKWQQRKRERKFITSSKITAEQSNKPKKLKSYLLYQHCGPGRSKLPKSGKNYKSVSWTWK